MNPCPPGKVFPGLPRRCPLRWSPHLPVLSTAALLLVLSLRPESTAVARESGGPRLPRCVQRELDRRLDRLAEFAGLLAAEPAGAQASEERLAACALTGRELLTLTIEPIEAGSGATCGPRPVALSAGSPAFDRVHRDGRCYRGAPRFDPLLGRWCVTLTAPLAGAAAGPALLRAEIDLSLLLAERAR
jgi:hypothetical protein